MGRRIVTGVPAGEMVAAGGLVPTTDDYLGRLVKYMPAEIVGLYLFIAGVVPRTDGKPESVALWVVFAACFVLTPFYMWFVTHREGGKALTVQVVLATVAFPIWVFAMGGPFMTLAWYRSWIASIVLAVVTTVFGVIRPAPGS